MIFPSRSQLHESRHQEYRVALHCHDTWAIPVLTHESLAFVGWTVPTPPALPNPPAAWIASVAELSSEAFHPTAERPTTELEVATVFKMPLVGVVVPIPTLPVKSATKMAVGAFESPYGQSACCTSSRWDGWYRRYRALPYFPSS